jgi:hypothetical protein
MRYTITRKLGSGAMADAFLAVRLGLEYAHTLHGLDGTLLVRLGRSSGLVEYRRRGEMSR